VQAVPVLLGVTVVVFLLVHIVPGDPASTILGAHATPESLAAIHHQYGLDKSLVDQYLLFLTHLVHGDIGQSVFFNESVASLLGARIVVSLWLVGTAALLALVIAIPLGVVAALKEDRVVDHSVRAFSLLALGMPSVWIGLMLSLVFGVQLGIFPVGGFGSGLPGHVHSIILPGLTIALVVAPLLIRSIRVSVLEIVHADFITAARARGLSERDIVFRHVLRNAAVPTLTIFSLQIAFLLGGTIVVENVFALPGMGQLLVQSAENHDFPVVQGIALVLAVGVIVINLCTDVVTALIDPRVQLGRR
jgi:peptide/nickel transport system permease protein